MICPTDDETKSKPTTCKTWVETEAAIDWLVAENSSLLQTTVVNAKLFLKFAAERYQCPDAVGLGYWPTICLSWSALSLPIEIEIFDDHYEFYRFSGKDAEIEHFDIIAHRFPNDLRMLLDAAIPRN